MKKTKKIVLVMSLVATIFIFPQRVDAENSDAEGKDIVVDQNESIIPPSQRLQGLDNEFNQITTSMSKTRALSSSYARSGAYKVLTNGKSMYNAVQRRTEGYVLSDGRVIANRDVFDAKEIAELGKEKIVLNRTVSLYKEPFLTSDYVVPTTLPKGEYYAYKQAGEFLYVRTALGDGWISSQYSSSGAYLGSVGASMQGIPATMNTNYIGNVPVYKKIINVGENSRPAIAMQPKYITIHNTGNTAAGANAKSHANLQYNGNSRVASWHFQVDNKEIWQSLPMNEIGWHAGDGFSMGNGNTVAIEICENEDGNYKVAEYNAAMLTAQLLIDLELEPTAVRMHNAWSGKNCPQNILENTKGSMGWNAFCNAVYTQYNNILSQKFKVGNQLNATYKITGNGLDIGISYPNATAKTVYKMSAYNINTSKWELISDWSAGNWSTWKLLKGNYWVVYDSKDSNDKINTNAFYFVSGNNYRTDSEVHVSNVGLSPATAGIGITVNFTGNSPTFRYKTKDIVSGKETYLTGWINKNTFNWQPTLGQYWVSAQVKDVTGVVEEYKTFYNVTGDFSPGEKLALQDMTWQIKSTGIDVGVSYIGGNTTQFKWQSYNLDEKKWEVISDWKSGNWSTWKPKKGNYWLHVEAKNADGKSQSKTINFKVGKDYSGVYNASVVGLTWMIKDTGIDVGAAYTSNDSQVKFKWQSYNLDTKKWEIISDWKSGNWSTWKPKKGNYWLHIETKTRDGKVSSQTICFSVGRDYSGAYYTNLTGLTWMLKNTGIDVGVAYKSNDNQVKFKWQSYNLDTKKWEIISDWKAGNWSTWKPKKGNYWLHIEAKTSDGKIASQTICFAVGKNY